MNTQNDRGGQATAGMDHDRSEKNTSQDGANQGKDNKSGNTATNPQSTSEAGRKGGNA